MADPAPSSSAEVPDVGYFGPDSVAWRLHRDPALLVGGLRALLIQALEPRAMAGVAQFSKFREDPWGRLERTSAFVSTVVFGTRAEADALGARVRAIHTRVRGFDAFGRPYRADDPELLVWVHAVEVHSFVDAYRRFGATLTNADADRYVDEMAISGELVGIPSSQIPRSMSDLREYFATVRGLAVTPEAIEGMRFVIAPPMPLWARPLWALPVAGAFATLPRFARDFYGVPWPDVATPPLRAAVWALGRILQRVLPGPPAYREAAARLGLDS
jgi:uncharacterized protein (DUF2236 family)